MPDATPPTDRSDPLTVHATCVVLDGRGVLLRGPPGSGKSDLALRLIDRGALLLADDRVVLSRAGRQVVARCPPAIAGRIEVRGIGLCRVAAAESAPLAMVVNLVGSGSEEARIERLPDREQCAYLGVLLPLVRLAAFEASAAAKLRAALSRQQQQGEAEAER